MPVYEYKCPACDVVFEAVKKMADYQEPQYHTCGKLSQKIMSRPMIAVDYPAYESPASGKWITGRKEAEEDLKRTGCRLLEPGEQKDMARRQVVADAAYDKQIDASVDKVYAELGGTL